jgi:prevent-host-death family protein
VKSVTATDVARRFSDVLDAVETKGETFLIVRRGRTIARLSPATGGHGRDVKALLRKVPRDADWVESVRRARAMLAPEDRRWRD